MSALPQSQADELLHVEGATACLGRHVVGPFDLHLQAGQTLAILGPSGAGKSTLLRLLSGELAPTSGVVRFQGKPMRQWTMLELSHRRAMLPQSYDVAFGLAAGLVVELGRVARRTDPQRDAIVQAALELARVPHVRQRRFHTLSGGEQARVQLARIFAQLWDVRGGLVLVDEPIAALDPGLQLELMHGLITFSRARRHALVAVLHDVNHALAGFERLLLVRTARQMAILPPDRTALLQLEALYGVRLQAVELGDGQWATVVRPEAVADSASMND
ncbi:MAG: ATP-binding cassette domain-containing protein, partial [Halothiobacillaceae bacterium]